VSSLGSLTADGGFIAAMDLVVTKVRMLPVYVTPSIPMLITNRHTRLLTLSLSKMLMARSGARVLEMQKMNIKQRKCGRFVRHTLEKNAVLTYA
jgi:hypothetical protein